MKRNGHRTENLQRIEAIFDAAMEFPAEQRPDFIRESCGSDAKSFAVLTALLEAESSEHEIIDNLPIALASLVDTALDAGETLGPFKIRREIGRGGMGIVYLAERDGHPEQLVALKAVSTESISPEAIARFLREHELLANLKHPNLVQVYEGGVERDYLYFAMEYIEAKAIVDFCDSQKLSCDQRIRLIIELCEVVEYTHRCGVLHRDLKPSNVLVAKTGEQWTVKVIDFGIAKLLHQIPEESALQTSAGNLLGTPRYMSPEQADSLVRDLDCRVDVFALGAILYELLSGTSYRKIQDVPSMEEPIDFARTKEFIQRAIYDSPARRLAQLPDATRIANDRSETVASLLSFLKGEVSMILQQALRGDRENRLATVSELRRRLVDLMEERTKTNVIRLRAKTASSVRL